MPITMKIEIPIGSDIKYEIDKDTGEMRVDRISTLTYPSTYGYIKNTIADDGDALDVFLLGHKVFVPGSIIDIDILGMIEMIDNGEIDNKVIAGVAGHNVNTSMLDRNVMSIKSFLKNYKKNTLIGECLSREHALLYYNKCVV